MIDMRAGICVVLLLAILTLSVPVLALEPFALYDNFQGAPLLNPSKWIGADFIDPPTSGNAEMRREIQGGQLMMNTRIYGHDPTNSGFNEFTMHTRFVNSAAINAIRATINLRRYELVACPANPAPARVRARIVGEWFAIGPTTPESAQNLVLATIEIFRRSDFPEPPDQLRVRGVFDLCLDPTCATEIFETVDLGFIQLGEATTLQIQWDPANNQFLYKRDDLPAASFNYGSLPVLPAPAFASKRLVISSRAPNCVLPPRPVAFVEANFDNVFVNVSAAP